MYCILPLLLFAQATCGSIDELIAETVAAKKKFLSQASVIDHELKDQVSHHSSLVQLKSLATLKEEAAKFEKSKQKILRHDAVLLEQRKTAFLDSLAKLNRDAKGPSSFLQINDSNEMIKGFFEPARKAAAKIHDVVHSITSGHNDEKVHGLDID